MWYGDPQCRETAQQIKTAKAFALRFVHSPALRARQSVKKVTSGEQCLNPVNRDLNVSTDR
jgi:phosphohistidine phosphatase SixA